MARHRKPTNVLQMQGAFIAHPERLAARANEPEVTEALGAPPKSFSADQRRAWIELAGLAPWLRSADRLAVEMASVLLVNFRVMGAAMAPPLVTRLETLLARLGMTPADRSKVSVPPAAKSSNPFASNGRRPPEGPR